MAPSYSTIADNILTAINEIVTGAVSSWTYSGKTYTMLNLRELQDLHSYYQNLANRASASSSVTVADMRSTRAL